MKRIDAYTIAGSDEWWFICKHCGILFTRRKSLVQVYWKAPQFCGHPCAHNGKRRLYTYNCAYCGTRNTKRRRTLLPKYCDVQCLNKGRREGVVPNPGLDVLKERARRGIKSPTIYVKGQPSHPNSVPHQFKKGHIGPGHKSIGDEVIKRWKIDGAAAREQRFRKVGDPGIWKSVARIVWEAANGPIPKGHVVRYLNGDSMDDRLENLQVVTRRECIILNMANRTEDQKRMASDRAKEKRLNRIYDKSKQDHRDLQEKIRESGRVAIYATPIWQKMINAGYRPGGVNIDFNEEKYKSGLAS